MGYQYIKRSESFNMMPPHTGQYQRIARFKKPQYLEFTSDFPLMNDGSPDRERIKEQFGQS